MTVDEALKEVETLGRGRTRFQGQHVFRDEVLATEVLRLREVERELREELDAIAREAAGASL